MITGAAAEAIPLGVGFAVIAAGALHASWNALTKTVSDRYAIVTLLGLSHLLGGLVMLPVSSMPAPGAWPWLAASVLVHVAYLVFLTRAYRLGDFNQTYPMARGLGPLVVAAVAAVALGELLSPTQFVGVALVSGALGFLAFAGRAQDGPTTIRSSAVAAALLTGLTIATYTLLDGIGVRASDSPLGYAGLLFIGQGLVAFAWAWWCRGRRLVPALVRWWPTGLVGGLISLTAYTIVLWAQTRGALAAVAALRETGVITGAILGVVFFKERLGVHRVIAAVAIAGGAALINLR